MNPTRAGIALFVLAVAAGPLYTVAGYSVAANLISELAAQNTPRSFVMSGAFVALGAGIVADGVRNRGRALLPFIAFGGFMALAGLFGHRPIAQDAAYSAWVDAAHSGLASAAGTAATIGFLWQALLRTTAVRRAVAGLLAILCVALPLCMLLFPALQGAIQRVMYASIFVWLWLYYPKRVHMQARIGQGAASGRTAR